MYFLKQYDKYLHPFVDTFCWNLLPNHFHFLVQVKSSEEIKENLILQLTGPVKWTQCVHAMIADQASRFTECGPGKVLQGLVMKIDKTMTVDGIS